MDPILLGMQVLTTGLGIFGAKKQYDAEQAAAQKEKEVGQLQARQHVNEMFLVQAEANRLARNRLQEHKQAEAENIAYFYSALGRSDQSIEAYMARQKQIADEDVETIERQLEVTKANLATQASVAWKYGQNAAAGIRAQSTANLLSNMSSIVQNLPPQWFAPKSGATQISGPSGIPSTRPMPRPE